MLNGAIWGQKSFSFLFSDGFPGPKAVAGIQLVPNKYVLN